MTGENLSHISNAKYQKIIVHFQIPLMGLENLLTSIRSVDPSKATGLDGNTQKTRNIFKKDNPAQLNGSERCNMSLQKESSFLS